MTTKSATLSSSERELVAVHHSIYIPHQWSVHHTSSVSNHTTGMMYIVRSRVATVLLTLQRHTCFLVVGGNGRVQLVVVANIALYHIHNSHLLIRQSKVSPI